MAHLALPITGWWQSTAGLSCLYRKCLSSPAVLLGPLQCLTFLLNHGLLAASLGAFWSVQAHWALSVPAAALVRVGGQLAYIALTSWTLNENLFALLMSNVYSLLVRAKSIAKHLLEFT